MSAPNSRGRLSAPVTNDAERAEFQQRVIFTLRVSFALALGFAMLAAGTLVVVLGAPVSAVFSTPATAVQVAVAAVTLGAWLLVRSRNRSVTFLDVTATVTTVAVCWGLVFTCTSGDAAARTELIALFAITCTLAMHAALVPSTALRTAGLGATTLVPLVLASCAMWIRSRVAYPAREAVYLTILCLIGAAFVTAISHVIYGLRQRARNAMQLGQYLLDAKIGEGGMGTVYRASHAMLRRPTAIKLISTANASSLARFEREVQLTASLRHPNTIAIFDYGRTPDGVFYYAMEYLGGITLDDLIREDGAQSPSRVVHLLLQVCGSLAEAHEYGLVHRDIKPANLMLSERVDEKDVMKVVDFGLVKDTSSGAMASSMNAILGTPYFMAPEAILSPEEVDRRADVYALGATAYYLLSGRHVFEGSNVVEICSAHIHQPPIPLTNRNPRIPRSLDEVTLRCLAKKPEDRPQTAHELADLLRACDVPAWTRADATDAWERLARKKTAPPHVDALSATITVALGDRERVA